jgi:hypothetical protein
MTLLREIPPFLLLAGAAWLLRAGPGSPVAGLGPVGAAAPRASLAPLAMGAGLCLLVAVVRATLRRAAAAAGRGPREPSLRFTLAMLGGAGWVTAVSFAAVALLPLLPDRRIPAIAALFGAALLLLRLLGEGHARRIPPPRGDERHWLLGFLYANPRDRAPLVPARLGLGYTPNLGRPLGWLLAAAALGVPVWLALRLAALLP